MPLTSCSTDKAVHAIIKNLAKCYKPESTNSKPMHKIEQLFVEAINTQSIQSQIELYIIEKLENYE